MSDMKKARRRPLQKIVTVKGRKFLFRVEGSRSPADYLKYEELRNAVWQYPQDNLPGGRNMMCENFLHDGSSLFIGVFAGDEKGESSASGGVLVGFSYGFVGLKDKDAGFRSPQNLQFYSQYNAVRADFRGFDLGIRMKEFQRDQVRDVFGIKTITCTYDPLTAVNAHRNVHHFGMDVLAYQADVYGEFGGLLNRLDVPRDRFFVSWDLDKGRRKGKADLSKWLKPGHLVVETERIRVPGKRGGIELETIREVRLDLDRDVLLLEIPGNFYRMLQETDVNDDDVRRIPVEWRLKTREAFQNFLGKGYRVSDFGGTKRIPRKYFYALTRARTSKSRFS
jgi:predicted GNAT superfamily acetyltransferase